MDIVFLLIVIPPACCVVQRIPNIVPPVNYRRNNPAGGVSTFVSSRQEELGRSRARSLQVPIQAAITPQAAQVGYAHVIRSGLRTGQ